MQSLLPRLAKLEGVNSLFVLVFPLVFSETLSPWKTQGVCTYVSLIPLHAQQAKGRARSLQAKASTRTWRVSPETAVAV
ncbi:hypothetical protein TGRH88_032430 [Toxoplasma gondii]|uniref:Secreted protein n=1 Tax=Toxoplasma gondii TaxID=5811 RepID=A0A7J6K907_TOXGO|nr:hypothetical protein TGRH88_032430 [Toxoplasma gondii]